MNHFVVGVHSWARCFFPACILDQGPIYTRNGFGLFSPRSSRRARLATFDVMSINDMNLQFRMRTIRHDGNKQGEETEYVKVISNRAVDRRTGRMGLYEPGAISRQQTTDGDTSGREPRAIRNELSQRNRTGAFTRSHTAGFPGTGCARGGTRPVYDWRRGLRSTARLSSFLSDGGRQLHGAGRPHAVIMSTAGRLQ